MTVYFIKPIGMDGPIKIGHSFSPDRRRETLALWSPFPLEIVAEYDGTPATERQFHTLFVGQHVHHEWFTPTPALVAVIASINDGSFDPAILPRPALLPRKKKDTSYITPEWRAKHAVQVKAGHARARTRREKLIADTRRPSPEQAAA